MKNNVPDTIDQFQRPSIGRWVKACTVTALVTPLLSPATWILVLLSFTGFLPGNRHEELALIVLGVTLGVGIVLAVVGVCVLTALIAYYYQYFGRQSTRIWAVCGAVYSILSISLLVLFLIFDDVLISFDGLISFVSAIFIGLVPGILGAFLFRYLLLRHLPHPTSHTEQATRPIEGQSP